MRLGENSFVANPKHKCLQTVLKFLYKANYKKSKMNFSNNEQVLIL